MFRSICWEYFLSFPSLYPTISQSIVFCVPILFSINVFLFQFLPFSSSIFLSASFSLDHNFDTIHLLCWLPLTLLIWAYLLQTSLILSYFFFKRSNKNYIFSFSRILYKFSREKREKKEIDISLSLPLSLSLSLSLSSSLLYRHFTAIFLNLSVQAFSLTPLSLSRFLSLAH